jgi:polar amino acid transport system substrate-binding protein
VKQLVHDPKAGTIAVVDLPEPSLLPGSLLVRNRCSVISPGTERAIVAAARSSYLRTARERPDLVRRLLDTVRREGILAAYRKVQAKLAQARPLGYACAGTVIGLGPGVGHPFRIGAGVACAGAGYASHAEIVSVPANLAAPIPAGVSFESAAFATLGAIALHGVRQSEAHLGEQWAVVGVGLLGLVTVQLLRAQGVRVAAFDLDPDLAERARRLGAEIALAGTTDEQVGAALAWTEGVGVDGVLVTATSASEAPMVAAAGMCRERGRVVAVGLVPFGLPREMAYEKELELRISRSYGPGRYDRDFEEKGLDYPVGYVRWTETRNLEAFLRLLAEGRVEVASLITHRAKLEEATRLYDLLLEREGPRPIGMVVLYGEKEESPRAEDDRAEGAGGTTEAAARLAGQPPRVRAVPGRIGTAFVGAGSFARSVLLPELARHRDRLALLRVVTAHGVTAEDARRKFGFEAAGTDPEEAMSDPRVDLVFIATRHDLHASLAARALRAGKHVFVEKPLALDEAGLREVEEAARSSSGLLLVGFNRRFAPASRAAREALRDRGAILAACRVNAGPLPPGHWLGDPDIGGGRMIGEGCHFVDLLSFLAGDPGIRSIEAAWSDGGRPSAEDLGVQIEFEDGSIGQLLYTARGSSRLEKERIEAHAGGVSVLVEDFRSCTIYRGRRLERVRGSGKGHAEEIAALLLAIEKGLESPIPLRVLLEVSRATFAAGRPTRGRY